VSQFALAQIGNLVLLRHTHSLDSMTLTNMLSIVAVQVKTESDPPADAEKSFCAEWASSKGTSTFKPAGG
jgi:hypothetical protein